MAALLLWSIGPLAVKSSESKPPIQYSTVDSMESSKIQLGQNGLLVVFSSKSTRYYGAFLLVDIIFCAFLLVGTNF